MVTGSIRETSLIVDTDDPTEGHERKMKKNERNCPQCRSTISKSAHLCKYCGKRFDDGEIVEQPSQRSESDETGPISALGCFGLLIGGVMLFNHLSLPHRSGHSPLGSLSCLDPIYRAAMLRIGPTIHNHTPYARVHSAFPPLFEGAIRQRALPRYRKLTFFCDFSRLRFALSPDKNMADENDARGGSAERELAVLNWRQGDRSSRPLGYCRCHRHTVHARECVAILRMPSRPATIIGVRSVELWQPGAEKQALACKRRMEWHNTIRDNRADGARPF
ncbi:hypothetical protein [Sphingopyxis terrae]|uniref:hypothetical protein n=1 Tax=Sphingopyxis terrae TaxID=33052 RepID=UPI002A0FBD2B|nr:hypothetical protein [Sphingopyxis terrae]MDX8357872.1 hypothetical protein [Sphingopyxis terrae]